MSISVGVVLLVIILIGVVIKSANDSNKEAAIAESVIDSARYLSVEQGEQCRKVYFDSSEICHAIRHRIGKASISLYYSDKKPDKSFVKVGEPIATLNFSWKEYEANPSTPSRCKTVFRKVTIASPREGYIVFHPIPSFGNESTFLVASIYDDYESLLNQVFSFLYKIDTDAFDKTTKIAWEIVNGDKTPNLSLSSYSFRVSFNLLDNKPILLIWYKYKTTRGTYLELLFDNQSILTYPLFGDVTSDGSIIVPLSLADVECFSSHTVQTIRVRKGEEISDYKINTNEQESLKRFSLSFKSAIDSIAEERELQEWVDSHQTEDEITLINESCWVYLMQDLANNAYKIGISNNPEYRERTLQSEKPSIVKIASKQYPSREIAKAIESSLHKVYQEKRMRGEWFRLEPKDVEEVKKSLE